MEEIIQEVAEEKKEAINKRESFIRILELQYPKQPEDSHNTPEYPILGGVDRIFVEELNLDESEAICK